MPRMCVYIHIYLFIHLFIYLFICLYYTLPISHPIAMKNISVETIPKNVRWPKVRVTMTTTPVVEEEWCLGEGNHPVLHGMAPKTAPTKPIPRKVLRVFGFWMILKDSKVFFSWFGFWMFLISYSWFVYWLVGCLFIPCFLWLIPSLVWFCCVISESGRKTTEGEGFPKKITKWAPTIVLNEVITPINGLINR